MEKGLETREIFSKFAKQKLRVLRKFSQFARLKAAPRREPKTENRNPKGNRRRRGARGQIEDFHTNGPKKVSWGKIGRAKSSEDPRRCWFWIVKPRISVRRNRRPKTHKISYGFASTWLAIKPAAFHWGNLEKSQTAFPGIKWMFPLIFDTILLFKKNCF